MTKPANVVDHIKIAYPNRPLVSLFFAVFFVGIGLIPGCPVWLGFGMAIGLVIDDVLIWLPLRFLNVPRSFTHKRKRLKTSLVLLGGLGSMAAMLALNFTVWSGTNHPLSGLVQVLNAHLYTSFSNFALYMIGFIVLVKIFFLFFFKNTANFYQLIIGMILGSIFASIVSAYIPSIPHYIDLNVVSVLLAGFVGALLMKYILKVSYKVILGNSNSDGLAYQHEGQTALAQSLADKKKHQWISAFKGICNKDSDVGQLVDEIIDYCKWRRKSHKDLVKSMGLFNKVSYYSCVNLMLNDFVSAPLDALMLVETPEDAISFIEYFLLKDKVAYMVVVNALKKDVFAMGYLKWFESDKVRRMLCFQIDDWKEKHDKIVEQILPILEISPKKFSEGATTQIEKILSRNSSRNPVRTSRDRTNSSRNQAVIGSNDSVLSGDLRKAADCYLDYDNPSEILGETAEEFADHVKLKDASW